MSIGLTVANQVSPVSLMGKIIAGLSAKIMLSQWSTITYCTMVHDKHSCN